MPFSHHSNDLPLALGQRPSVPRLVVQILWDRVANSGRNITIPPRHSLQRRDQMVGLALADVTTRANFQGPRAEQIALVEREDNKLWDGRAGLQLRDGFH